MINDHYILGKQHLRRIYFISLAFTDIKLQNFKSRRGCYVHFVVAMLCSLNTCSVQSTGNYTEI